MWHSPVGCIITLALSILAMALAATAQPVGKVYRIGRLSAGAPPTGPNPTLAAFQQGLRDLGYHEGHDMVIESRYAEGKEDRLSDLAVELVRLPVDVLVAAGSAAIQAAQHATRTIPIVMAAASDPVGQGFVTSLARPEGNLTGLSSMNRDLSGKQLELLMETVPTGSRIAVLVNPADPSNLLRLLETQRAAERLGVPLQVLEARSRDDLEQVLSTILREGVSALFVIPDPLLLDQHRREIAAWALQRRVPTMYNWRMYVEAGGLMSYGPSLPALHYRAAYYVDRLLKGATPADLPVEQPRKFELVLNLKTAQILGITMPPSLLLLADEVIQ